MSLADEEMIARLRCSYEAFNRGDFDAAMEFAHPDILFVRPGAQAEVRGAEAFRAWMEPDAFESQVIEPLEFRVSGNKVLVRQHATARGAGSGIEIDIESMTLWTCDQDGKATRIEFFLPHQETEALAALGAD